jgi:hypothetical protein
MGDIKKHAHKARGSSFQQIPNMLQANAILVQLLEV